MSRAGNQSLAVMSEAALCFNKIRDEIESNLEGGRSQRMFSGWKMNLFMSEGKGEAGGGGEDLRTPGDR